MDVVRRGTDHEAPIKAVTGHQGEGMTDDFVLLSVQTCNGLNS